MILPNLINSAKFLLQDELSKEILITTKCVFHKVMTSTVVKTLITPNITLHFNYKILSAYKTG